MINAAQSCCVYSRADGIELIRHSDTERRLPAFFMEQAAPAGEDALRLALQGLVDVGKMQLGLVFQLLLRGAAAWQLTAREILSGEAALKTLPAFVLLSGLTALLAVRCAAGLLFSVCRRLHCHFF